MHACMHVCMYVCTRVLPSISIDDGVFKHCSSEASAEVLDQFGGIEHYSGTAVGLRLRNLWINLAESSVMSPLERRFGQPKDVKLALEWRCGQPEGQVGPGGRFEWPKCPWSAPEGRFRRFERKKVFSGFSTTRMPEGNF